MSLSFEPLQNFCRKCMINYHFQDWYSQKYHANRVLGKKWKNTNLRVTSRANKMFKHKITWTSSFLSLFSLEIFISVDLIRSRTAQFTELNNKHTNFEDFTLQLVQCKATAVFQSFQDRLHQSICSFLFIVYRVRVTCVRLNLQLMMIRAFFSVPTIIIKI